MTWVKGIVGVICVLFGLLWIGQGTNLMPGSIMSGQLLWVVIGLVVRVVGAGLLWSMIRARSVGAPRA
jgi:hypothetical protein